MNSLYSIIIPTYNSEATLSIALESIVAQTFKNWEVIIMDGLSSDSTLEIANKFKKHSPNKIKIYSEKDKGIYDAMNKGIELAEGEWLYFMGSDDSFYNKNVLKNVIEEVDLQDQDVVYGNVYSTRFGGKYDGEFTYSKLVKKNICHQSIFFNKQLFEKTGKFNLKYNVLSDWDHNIKWFFSSRINKIYVNLIIANYADDGYSSISVDEIFNTDKFSLLIRRGWNKLPIKEVLKLVERQEEINKDMKDYFSIFIYKFFKIMLKVIVKLKK